MPFSPFYRKLSQVGSRTGVLLLACFLSACGNDIEKTKMFERQTLPESTIKNAEIQRSENGRLQMVMNAPLIEKYSNPEEKTEYRKGVLIHFYNGYDKPTGILQAQYAVNYDKRETMVVRDSVVIIDLQRGDTIYLQDLTWNQMEHRIYSENPLRTQNGPRVTYGDRFESDDAFEAPRVFRQRGTIVWKEDEE